MKILEEWQDYIYPAILKRKIFKAHKTTSRIQIFCDFLRRITVAVFI